MINLEYYRAFYMVAKNGSLTAAAKELFISQPALSQTVLNLEQQLGGQLFIRTPKGMELTPEGRIIYDYCEQALNIFDTAQKHFEEMKHLKAGSIRIGASDTLCNRYLLKHISLFHKLYPDIGIQVTNRTSNETTALLRSGKVDIAFVNLPIKNSGFEIRECLELNDCFIGNYDYFSKLKEPQSINDISRLPLIMMEKLSNTRQQFDAFMLSNRIVISPAAELGSFDLVVEFAKNGLGIGCVTREFVKSELDNSEIYEIPIDFELPKRAIGCVLIKNSPLTFAADRFMEIISGFQTK